MKKQILLLVIQIYFCTSVFTQTNRYSTYQPTEWPKQSSFQVGDVLTTIDTEEQLKKDKFRNMYVGRIHLYNGLTGHDTYLGCLNCPPSDALSVWNSTGKYGINSSNEDNIWNKTGLFGNPNTDYSPWNLNGTKPPVIVDFEGNFYGYFTANENKEKRTESKIYQMITKSLDLTRKNYYQIGDLTK
jgi:hypothetical protein